MMTIRQDLRDLKRISREVTMWAREIEAAARPKPPKPAPAIPLPAAVPWSPPASLPPEYSLVTCKDCDSPAMLLRDRHSFAALCPSCRVITHLESIDPESTK